ncbi:MAG: peptidylprolyl isomerase [Candidatus Omnitrophota bacterium]
MVLNILRSRKFSRRILLAVLILILPAFVLWGMGSVTSRPDLIGEIGRRKIYLDDFAKSRRGIKAQVLFSYYGDYAALNQILNNRSMLNLMAWERLLLLEAARDKKIRVANADVLSFIARHPLFQRNGIFQREAYESILRNTLSMTPRQFEELVRENLRVRILRQEILKNTDVSEKELLEYYGSLHDQVELSYVLLNKSVFMPEKQPSDEEIKKFYETNIIRYTEMPKTEVEYIALPYADNDGKNSVLETAEKIYAQLETSSSGFSETAEKFGLRYGKTSPFSREDTIPGIVFFKEFPEAAFSLKKGETSSLIFPPREKGTAYILRKIKDTPPRKLSFQEAREAAIKDLSGEEALARANEEARISYAKTKMGSDTLEETAQKFGLKVQQTGPISSEGYVENVGSAKKMVAAARKLAPGDIVPPISLENGTVLARIDRIVPASEAAFEEEKAKLREALLIRKQMQALEAWFRENKQRIILKRSLEGI